MEFLAALWLPIVLSAVLVFLVSWVLHVFVPLHKGDMRKFPDEERMVAAIREQKVGPGDVFVPLPAVDGGVPEPRDEGAVRGGAGGPPQRSAPPAPGGWEGPRAAVPLLRGPGRPRCLRDVGAALGRGAAYGKVFQVAGTIAILAHAASYLQDSIWKGTPWKVTAKFVFDGVVYGLVTAGAFAGFWPR